MTTDRVTRYGQNHTGDRNLGVTVRGVRILVQPDNPARQSDAEEIARQIAALGPAEGPQAAPVLAPPSRPIKPRPEPFRVGERIYCTVHGTQGWCTVTEVGEGRNRGRIKITGERAWCPASNFAREQPAHLSR